MRESVYTEAYNRCLEVCASTCVAACSFMSALCSFWAASSSSAARAVSSATRALASVYSCRDCQSSPSQCRHRHGPLLSKPHLAGRTWPASSRDWYVMSSVP
eukprot:6206417-Pleurochrysis_carterae.AAC.3